MTTTGARVPVYMVVAGYLPLALVLTGIGLAVHADDAYTATGRLLAWVYLVPPLLSRLALLPGPPLADGAPPDSAVFRRWWLLTQLQMLFNRVGLLEDLLRLVPGLYSAWLNLWGSRVSLMTFWARDVVITERYLLTIAPGVTVAGQVGIVAHLVTPGADGGLRLLVAPIVVERGAMLGIRSGVGPGCRVFANEVLPAGRMLPPFSGWRNGARVRLAEDAAPD